MTAKRLTDALLGFSLGLWCVPLWLEWYSRSTRFRFHSNEPRDTVLLVLEISMVLALAVLSVSAVASRSRAASGAITLSGISAVTFLGWMAWLVYPFWLPGYWCEWGAGCPH